MRTEIVDQTQCGCTAVVVEGSARDSCPLTQRGKFALTSSDDLPRLPLVRQTGTPPARVERSKGPKDEASPSDSLLTRVMHDVAKGVPPALNRGRSACRVKPRMSTYTSKAFHNCLQAALVASLSTHDRRSRKTRAFPSRRRIYSSWRADQCVFEQDRAMCGKGCPGRSSDGGNARKSS